MNVKPLYETSLTPIRPHRSTTGGKRKRKKAIPCRIYPELVLFGKRRVSRAELMVQFDRNRVIILTKGRRYGFRASDDFGKHYLRTRLVFAIFHYWILGDNLMFEKSKKAEVLTYFLDLTSGLPGLVEVFVLAFIGAGLDRSGVGSFWTNLAIMFLVLVTFYIARLIITSHLQNRIEPVLLATPARIPPEAL